MTKKQVQDKVNELNEGPYPLPITIIDYASEEPQPCLDKKTIVINFPEEMYMWDTGQYDIFYCNYPDTLDTEEFKDFVTSISFVDNQ